MFSVIWWDSNWKKVIWALNIAMAIVVGFAAWYDIYQTQISDLMDVLRIIQVSSLVLCGIGHFKNDEIQAFFYGRVSNHKLFKMMAENDLKGFKRVLAANKVMVNQKISNGGSLLNGAAYFGNSAMVKLILEAGADPVKLTSDNASPVVSAIMTGSYSSYKYMKESLNNKQFEALVEALDLAPLLLACYEGDYKRVTELANKGNVNLNYESNSFTPLHMVMLGSRDKGIIELLVNLGANPTGLCKMELRKDSVEITQSQYFSPLMLALIFQEVELALFFYSRTVDALCMEGEKDHVMFACELGLSKYVDVVMTKYNWKRKTHEGTTALDFARQFGHQNIINKVNSFLTSGVAPTSASNTAAMTLNNGRSTKVTNEQIEDSIALSLVGMVGMDNLIQNLTHDIGDFARKHPGESKGIVVWGDASVGKTEFAQRLAGLKQEFNIPGLDVEGVEVKYIACCDGQIDIAREVAEAVPKSIIILDEIDKFFNPQAGLVDDAQAKKLRTSIVTNFQNKPIFWIFAGTFHDLRGKNRLNEKDLSNVLGTELASRLDFADWQLPSWNLGSILEAAKEFLNRDTSTVSYEDEGVVVLAEQALQSGGGVRQFQKYHDYFKRKASRGGAGVVVTGADAREYLKILNVG